LSKKHKKGEEEEEEIPPVKNRERTGEREKKDANANVF